MKKNAMKKLLAAALTGAMAVGTLAGCASGGSPAPAGADTPVAEEAPAAQAPAAETPAADAGEADALGFTPFADQVDLTIAVYDRGDAGNGASDVVNNYWTNWIQENFGDAYNIKVTYVPITRSDVMKDYAMLASTNTLPTLCMEYDYDKLATWVSEGYLQPYDLDEFKAIAPTYYQSMVDNNLTGYIEMAGDNYLMAGKRPYGHSTYTWCTWYRKDWLKEAGYDELPVKDSELLELYAKLVENGHEYPLSGSKVAGAGADQNYGYRDYPQDEITWATTGDYQIPALSTEAQKRFLRFENELYNKGYKNPEYYLRAASDVEADFINGKAFQWSGYVSSTMNVLNSLYENEPDAELGLVVCPSEFIQDEEWGNSNAYRPGGSIGAMIGFANNATEDQMKAGMMYLEWLSQPENLFTMQWGIEGKNFNYEDGKPVAVGDQSGLEEQQGHNNNVDYWMVVTAIKVLGNIEDDIKAINPQGLPQDFYEDILANYNGQTAIYEAGYANVDCAFAAALDSVAEYGTALKEEVYPELRDQLTMCAPEEFDALYEECSKKYLEAGYQAVIDERNELFENGQTTRLAK